MKSIEELKKLAAQQEVERITRVKSNIAKYGITAERIDQIVQKAAIEKTKNKEQKNLERIVRKEEQKEKAQSENQHLQTKIQQLEQLLAEREQEIATLKEKLATIRKVAA